MKERLLKASQTALCSLRADSLPDKKLSEALSEIQNGLTAGEGQKGGRTDRLAATIAQMTEMEAREWSLRIVDLAIDVTRRSAIES